jgi:hypothetical protein
MFIGFPGVEAIITIFTLARTFEGYCTYGLSYGDNGCDQVVKLEGLTTKPSMYKVCHYCAAFIFGTQPSSYQYFRLRFHLERFDAF